MASRAAARSAANSSSVELTKTRTRWSGVRIAERLGGAAAGRLSVCSGCSVSIVHQSFSKYDAFASMKCAVENWEADFNVACLFYCSFLSPVSIVEDTSFVTLHHLRRLMAYSFCSPL
jgi:hypothetical protein